jgi:hypothetical protein
VHPLADDVPSRDRSTALETVERRARDAIETLGDAERRKRLVVDESQDRVVADAQPVGDLGDGEVSGCHGLASLAS